ncbi:MAG: hypothetical protein JSW12_19220 [Deltaproteobacteria bacterium]|nr:MAG: hypothetical protein JSW12_19220 [Deltaproteobacteria bacterium]
METVALIISIVALIIAIVAYYRTGGVAALKKEVEALTSAGETMVSKATDSLRDKTADVLGKVEEAVRGDEETKEQPKTAPKKEPNK